jgi:hypothetical protein
VWGAFGFDAILMLFDLKPIDLFWVINWLCERIRVAGYVVFCACKIVISCWGFFLPIVILVAGFMMNFSVTTCAFAGLIYREWILIRVCLKSSTKIVLLFGMQLIRAMNLDLMNVFM